MGVPWAAILAGALGGQLDEPRYVRFQTADGGAVSGELTAWDAQGFDGSFGHRAWKELVAADAWRLYVTVMDRGDAAQWVDLGRALLDAPQGDTWADRAFRKAIELDKSMETRVQDARAEARRRRDETRQAADAQRLRTQTPEAGAWPATTWAPQGPAIRQAALEALRAEVPAMLSRSGIALEVVETEHFLVYADLPRLEAAQLGARLEAL